MKILRLFSLTISLSIMKLKKEQIYDEITNLYTFNITLAKIDTQSRNVTFF